MSPNVYNPSKLLKELIEIEQKLNHIIADHCPDNVLTLKDDLDVVLEEFLSKYDIEGKEVSFLSSQYAMLHLQQKVAKTRKVIVEVNNLRALDDFYMMQDNRIIKIEQSGKPEKVYRIAFVGCVLFVLILMILGYLLR